MATTSFVTLAEELRKLRGQAHKRFGKEIPVVYEIEVKESGAPDLKLVDSITAVVSYLRGKEVPEKTLEAHLQVFVVAGEEQVETEGKYSMQRMFRYVGKTDFLGGRRRLMYKKGDQEELNVGAAI